MKVGFDVSDQETEQNDEQGYADTQTAPDEEHWFDDLGDFIFRNLVGFCMIYGIFAAIRDLIRCIF